MEPVYGPELLDRLSTRVVGRRRELEVIIAALAAGRHLLLEGPPGTGKSTVLRAIAEASASPPGIETAGSEQGGGFEFVEGNAELTPARLTGSFDPSIVLSDGYTPAAFLDGPLTTAMRDGSMLYIEEINRIPEETLNVLITVMSEGEITVPRLGRLRAADGFRLVAAMNPFDAVGTARIASAVYDRCCRLAVDYQSVEDEVRIVTEVAPLAAAAIGSRGVDAVVAMVRETRRHRDIRTGSSVRGAIDLVLVAHELASLRDAPTLAASVSLDASLLALTGRIRPREGCGRTAEQIVTGMWRRHLLPLAEPEPDAAATTPDDSGDVGAASDRSGKA